MSEFTQFLIVRPDDLVLLGVQWSGFRTAPAAGSGAPPALEALTDAARIVLTFPPQAIAEERYSVSGDVARRQARLAGPSRIEFSLRAGTRVPLDAQGILAALMGGASLVSSASDDRHTVIEMPWGLIVSVKSRAAGVEVVSEHHVSPVASPSGMLALWRTRLHGNAGDADAGLALLPLRVKEELDPSTLPLPFDVPLSLADRSRIVFESTSEARLPRVSRFELSALGGSFSARAVWPTFAWDHDATLGRDRRVRVQAKGVLYPFGHRAEFQELTERIFDPPGADSVAGLHRSSVLVVTEHVRGAVDDPRMAREFPFSEVEILTRTFTDVTKRDPRTHPYRSSRLQPKQEELVALRQELNELGIVVNMILSEVPAPDDIAGFAVSSFATQEVLLLQQVWTRIGDFSSQLEQAEAEQQAHDAALDEIAALQSQIDSLQQTPTGPDGETDPGIAAEISALSQQIQAIFVPPAPASGVLNILRNSLNQALAEEAGLLPTVQFQLQNLPRDVGALANSGDPSASRFVDLSNTIIPALESEILAIDQAQENIEVSFWPAGRDAQLVKFPMRCKGTLGDLYFSLPLIFVHDVFRPAEPDRGFDEFSSLVDDEVLEDLKRDWQSHAAVPLPGIGVDVVRSEHPQPSDVQEVHELSILGVEHGGAFRPKLSQFKVEMPALRALLPGLDGRVPLAFTPEFLSAGNQVDTPLKLVEELLVDFTGRADRSGGLVAPKFSVDAISRTLGPIPTGALPGVRQLNLESVYKDATLLGFPLGSVIKTDGPNGLPKPPAIIQVLESGRPPGVRMEWRGLTLKSHPPFQANDSTSLDLTVETSPSKTETTCKVENFSLVLPPSGPALLTMIFRSLVFTQQPGRAPDLQVNGLHVEFAGALELLRKLQEELQGFLDLGSHAPLVSATPTGISASYTLSVPSVKAGAFLMRNIAMRVAVDIPFDRNPVTVSLAFASRANPFNLSVLMFGGGGYIDLQIGPSGLTRLEASLEFGASIGIDFIVASGEVHALGGLRFIERNSSIELDAFLRFGGSVEVLGLVSVSVELVVTLRYESVGNRLVGRATLVLEIDLTLYSDSVELDSGEWVLIGSDDGIAPPAPAAPAPVSAPADDPGLRAWRAYQEAFAS